MSSKHTHIIEARSVGFNKAAKDSKKLKGSLSSLKKSVVGLAGAYLGAAGLIAGVKGSVGAYLEQERVERKLRLSMGKTADGLFQQANALSKLSTESDEAIIAQQAFLASIGMTEQQIRDILPVALDLSAATGITLESAVRNTAKTFSGLAGELGELVPQLRDLSPEAMKAGEAVEVMGELFRDQASVEAGTLSGKLTRVKNVMLDIAEDVGGSLAGTVEGLADAFLDLNDALTPEEQNLRDQNDMLREYNKLTQQIAYNTLIRAERTQGIIEMEERHKQLQEELGLSETATSELRLNQMQEEHNMYMNNTLEEIGVEDAKFKTTKEKIEDQIKLGKQLAVQKLQELTFEKDGNDIIKAGTKILKLDAVDRWRVRWRMAQVDAASAVIKAYRDGGPPPANFLAAGAVAAQQAPQLATVYANKPAQTGFEGVVDEPTQFTVGEGGAAEYVSVTPLEGVNNAGGQGMTINISGNVMSQDYIENEFSEGIAEAIRKGISFA
jgi:hypothetical protein